MRILKLGLDVELMSTRLLWVAPGSPESAVGSDDTLWATCSYPQKSSAHQKIAVYVSIRRRPVHTLYGVLEHNHVWPSGHPSYSCVH